MTLVEVEHGLLRGTDGEVRRYCAVPYAAPPTGDLRWTPPEPPQAWTGERDATCFGPDCPQPASVHATTRASGHSEDCLSLDVWAPADPPAEGCPVMVWLFGGSFLFGSSSSPQTDGAAFARHGIVFVAPNYRVGVLGFLARPELTAESPHGSSGNYGLLDQVAALGWVRRNIAAFGGDPRRVTAAGVSAGSASISLLNTSPVVDDLFDQVILESPGSFRPLASLDEAEHAGAGLGLDLPALRRLPVDDVLALASRLNPAVRGLTTPRVLRPVRDGWLIAEDERDAYAGGRFGAVPTIVGSNALEGASLTETWPVDTVAAWHELLAANYGDLAGEARRLYGVREDGDVRAAVAHCFGDTQFSYGAREIARATSRRQPDTYRYLFTRRRAGGAQPPDHGGEVSYVFTSLDHDGRGPVDDTDRRLAGIMQSTWARFVAAGDPNTPELPEPWPRYDERGDVHLELGDEIGTGRGWRSDTLDLVDRIHASR